MGASRTRVSHALERDDSPAAPFRPGPARRAYARPGGSLRKIDPEVRRRAANHSDPDLPGPPHGRQFIGVVLSLLAIALLLGLAPMTTTTIAIALLLIGVSLL